MRPFPFVDARGRAWHVYDYVATGWGSSATRRSLAIGDRNAECRAFVPVGRQGPVMVYPLAHGSWHGTESRTLESQLYYSKPLDAPAGEVPTGQRRV
jgi:hypothetical protein